MGITKSKIASACATSGSYKSKSYGDMIDETTAVLEGGFVTGVLKHVTGYTEAFSGAEADGYFFPLHLADEYKKKDIRVKRISGRGGQEKKVQDTDWVLRVTDGPNTVYTFKQDEEDDPFLTLNFSQASFVYSAEELHALELASRSTKNYTTSNGDELVIGGKLTVLDGAEVTGISGGGSSYTLPTASAEKLGGVKPKAKTDESVEITVDGDGKLWAPAYPKLAVAAAETLGGVKPKAKTNESVEVTIDGDGKLWAPAYPIVPAAPTNATAEKEGLVKQAAAVTDAADTEGASLKTTLDALLKSLRTAGILASS